MIDDKFSKGDAEVQCLKDRVGITRIAKVLKAKLFSIRRGYRHGGCWKCDVLSDGNLLGKWVPFPDRHNSSLAINGEMGETVIRSS